MSNEKRIATVVAYPSTDPKTGDPITFDMDYYTSKHMPLIDKVWGPHGMHSWSINRFANPDPFSQQPAPWAVQTTVYWPSMDAFKAAMADPGSQVTGADVPKFTNVFPVIWTGEVGAGEGREGIEGNKNFVYGEGGY